MINESQIQDMPFADKVELLRILKRVVRKEKFEGKEVAKRAKVLMGCLQESLGWNGINTKSREVHLVWARTMLATQLIDEGYHPAEIGEALGKTHAAVYHYKDKMRDVFDLPEAYRDIIEQWNKFQSTIKKYDIQRRTNSDPVPMGGELPDSDQGQMGEESGQDSPQDNLGDIHQGNR